MHIDNNNETFRNTSDGAALSISFSGPYLYDFRGENQIDIYAPYCPSHEAGFFYSDNSRSETDLWACAQSDKDMPKGASRCYTINSLGIAQSLGPPKLIGPLESTLSQPNPIKILTPGDAAKCNPRFNKMLFKLSVPIPTWVYPLYSDRLEVVDGYDQLPNGNSEFHATGLRFFYQWDGSQISLELPSKKSCNITPPVFRQLPTIADIEVRYAGVDVHDRNDPHSDARSCFASLTTMAGFDWWLNYGDCLGSPTNPSKGSATAQSAPDPCAGIGEATGRFLVQHTGADCHAPIIALGWEGD